MTLYDTLTINRAWGFPSVNTFEIAPIKDFVSRHVSECTVVVDPFANRSKFGTITNDLNHEYDTSYHLDALDFLKMFDDKSVDCVLYDPPYSTRQVVEQYKGFGKEITRETTQSSWRARHLDEIQRILKQGGRALCFGWNSNGVGKKRGFSLKDSLY